MTPISLDVYLAGDPNLAHDFLQDELEALVAEIQRTVGGGIGRYVRKHYGRAPSRGPTYPIAWTSQRQRIYMLFLSDIEKPYQRTHEMVRAWNVFITTGAQTVYFYVHDDIGAKQTLFSKRHMGKMDRMVIGVYNPTPYAVYVQGAYQQAFHAETGWKNIENDAIIVREAEALLDRAIEKYSEGRHERLRRKLARSMRHAAIRRL